MNRSKKAFRNVITGLANKLLLMILAFITRTLFIRILGAEYTGVSSLFTNILSVLSLAELGVGNVLMFYLYSALKDGDTNRIQAIVREFRRIYYIIIVVVILCGLALIPILHIIVKSDIPFNKIVLYYGLYLLNSIASYFVIYRTMVLTADQKIYVSNILSSIIAVLMYATQILYLTIRHDFTGYLLIQVLFTLLNNVILNSTVLKKYPYLHTLPRQTKNVINRKDLILNIKATFLFKVSDTILDQTDSIIISVMFGTAYVGYYYNYYLIITYIVQLAGIIANGLLASFGNLNAEGDMRKSYKMFRVAMLGFSAIGAYCSACYICVIQDFIPVWIGKDFLLDDNVVWAVAAVFYLRMVTNTMWMYRSSMGLFQEVQYINLLAAVLNIILSIILGYAIGVSGVIVATAISRLVTAFWYEGKVLFTKFGQNVRIYYYQQLKDLGVCCVIILLSKELSSLIDIHGLVGMFVKIIIITIISVVVELITHYRDDIFIDMIRHVKSLKS